MRSSWYPLGALILRVSRKLRDNRSDLPLEPSPAVSLIPLLPEQLTLLDRRSRHGQDLRVLVRAGFFAGSSISLTVRSGPPASTISTRFGSMDRNARKLLAP
jgi:hypothetical protein